MFSRELRWPMTYMLVARLCWSCGLHANTGKNNVETKNIVHKQNIQVFNNNYLTCFRDEDLSRRAFVLARFRLRTPKVWKIVHGKLFIARRTFQVLYALSMGIIFWQYLTLRYSIASSHTSMAALAQEHWNLVASRLEEGLELVATLQHYTPNT